MLITGVLIITKSILVRWELHVIVFMQGREASTKIFNGKSYPEAY